MARVSSNRLHAKVDDQTLKKIKNKNFNVVSLLYPSGLSKRLSDLCKCSKSYIEIDTNFVRAIALLSKNNIVELIFCKFSP